MIITLTDATSGIKFEIDTNLISSCTFGKVTEIELTTGEKIFCRESSSEYLAAVGESVKAFFGGAK